MAEAVRAMPWIHVKVVGPEDQSREMWFSFSRNVTASREIDRGVALTCYEDLRSEVQYCYDSQKKKLYRLSVGAGTAKELNALAGFFQTIFRGDAFREEDSFVPPLISQRQRTVTEDGRRWILYELKSGDPDHSDSMVIRVDPQTKLPERMTGTHGKDKLEATFDYPAEGLADIYALGVPRDAPIEDRTPSADLSRISKIVQQNRRDFGDYLAIAGGNNENRPSVVHLIRCKGDKWRVDTGIGYTKRVASSADLGRWWQEHGPETLPEGLALCDGRRVYWHSLVHPEAVWQPSMNRFRLGDDRAESQTCIGEADYFVELLAYPPHKFLTTSPFDTVRLDPKGENGPAGSVRVEILMAKQGGPAFRNMYHKEEFWLQPKYGYAVVKHVLSDCPAVDEDPQRKEKRSIYEYDDFRQTPGGLWYPTVARQKNASWSQNKNTGGVELHDQVTYFYLDFTAELPDELFSTGWQGDPLLGIHFAERDEKPTSNDLGKIRPPGGVPLFFGGPGKEISVHAVERARQRLEAAPPADLERWIVELERIIDKKLKDGLPSARQVCRTDFVIHMSVAFDGVKWNSKRADNLFQRAQTMPASEAKVWKEAFEALLKKEIGQTDTSICDGGPAWAVPLVLIPVDALYEGQKYSAERAKKYLARMKQLTADDVSLWKDKVDEWGGTRLDASMNIILLDDYFDKERFQRDKFKAAIEARKK